MFDLRKIPMLRVLVPFFGGVLTGINANTSIEPVQLFIPLTVLTLLVFVIFKWQRNTPAAIPWLNPLVLLLIFFLTGLGSGIHSRPHDPALPEDRWVLVRGELCGPPRPAAYGHVFDMKVQLIGTDHGICQIRTVLRCHMSEPADSLFPATGEHWQYCGRLAGIRESGNPGMPDYRTIMGRNDCWYRFYISSSALASPHNKKVEAAERKLDPVRIRRLMSGHWQGDAEAVSLLKAVCLGDRTALSDDMYQAYRNAGGMHLLAVSGLHVGLIWWVLQHMTAWMSLIFRRGTGQNMLVLALLWFYAFLTGFSSSVCRSVTMFSFFSLSRIRGEGIQTLNVVLASAFLLVLTDPLRLMDVGFQLSYAAITGIVTIHPLSIHVLRLRHPVLRWIWEAASVSLAAQLATFPLVIYYFHQLPVYSLITSLIAIPLLSVLIAIFVCSVPFVLAGILERFSSFLLVTLARFMNRSMEYLSEMPGAVLDELQLEPAGLLIWLLALLLIVAGLHGQKRLPFHLLLLLIAFYLILNTFSGIRRCSGSELVIAHFRGASHVSIRSGTRVDHYCWYRDSISVDFMETYRTQAWNRRIFKNRVFEFEGEAVEGTSGGVSCCIRLREGIWLLGAGGICGMVLRGAECTELPGLLHAERSPGFEFRPDFILLSAEPSADLRPIMHRFEEVDLVIDGSSRSWYKERMWTEYERIHFTDLSGAYVKRW